MGRSRDIADMLSKTELANTNNEKLITTFDAVDSAYVSDNSVPALVFYSTLDSLPVTSLTSGQQAYVSANNRLYISDGSGWYNKALIRLSPTMTLSPSGTITLADDGTTTSTVTIIPADSDTPLSQLTYSVESDGNMLGRAVLSQDSSVFTIRPLSSDSGATDGTFTLTFKTTDADTNFATATKDFSLTFATGVSGSASTINLVKAHGNNITNSDITYYNSSNTQSGFTEAGDPTAATFSPYRSGGYSTYFDGTGDYLTSSSVYSGVGSSADFTAEAWIWIDPNISDTNPLILCSDNNGFNFGVKNSSGFKINVGHSYVGDLIVGSTTISTGTWTHIAAVRNSGTLKAYVNGVEDASVSDTSNFAGTTNYIGSIPALTNYDFHGYVRDARFVSGTAVYTSTFTPPTRPLTAISGTTLLACHLPYIADGSTNNYTFTVNGNTKTLPYGPYDYYPWSASDNVGSVHFDGNDTISAAAIDLTGDYTVEGWVYLNEIGSGYRRIFQNKQGNVNAGYWYFYHNGTNLHVYNVDGGTLTNVGTIPGANQWIHLAISRSGSTTKIFVNGKQTGTYSGSTSFTADTFAISGYNTEYINGYVADVRVSVGTGQGLYTADFTPPTEPLTRTSPYTKLLMSNLQSLNTVPNASVYDAAAAGRVTLTGNWASRSTTRKFTTSSSVGGTGSLLLNELTPEYLGGDFTIQFWLYPASWSNGHLFGHWDGTNYHPMIVWQQSGSNILFYASSNASSWNLASAADTGIATWTNSWKHIAMTYDQSAGEVKFWLDGTLESTHTSITGWTSNSYTSSIFSIGADNLGGSSSGSHYVQDLKISRSVEYTTNFTVPTAEFEL